MDPVEVGVVDFQAMAFKDKKLAVLGRMEIPPYEVELTEVNGRQKSTDLAFSGSRLLHRVNPQVMSGFAGCVIGGILG